MHVFTPLAPRARWLFHLQALSRLLLFWVPLTAVAAGTAAVLWSLFYAALIAVCWLFLLFLLAVWYPSLSFERWGYALQDEDLLIRRGVLIRSITAIPTERIQHVDTRQGPLEQWFGLARVQVYTASGLGADGVVPGLELGDAEALRDQLVALGGQGDDGVCEVPWSTLHPASVVVNLVPRAWGVVRNAWPLFLAMLYGRSGSSTDTVAQMIDLGILGVFFTLTIGSTVLHFLTLRYRVSEGRLEIRSGLLNRQTRVISADRIQNTETVRNLFHRLSGLVEVRVETASGTEVEGLLSALSTDEAKRLIDTLDEARRELGLPRPEAAEAELPVVVANGLPDLAWFGGTGTRWGVIAVVFGVLIEGLTMRSSTLQPEDLESVNRLFAGLGAVAVIVAAITGAWVFGVGTAVVRHFGFTLRQKGAALVAEEGLFTRRRVELRMSKVQLVTVVEPFLRRLAGFGSIQIETAAAREGGDGTQRSEAMVPVVDASKLYAVVDKAVPIGALDLASTPLRPPDRRALLRATAAGMGRAAVVAAIASWWLWPGGLVAWLLVPLAIALARLDHRHQGWLVTDDVIVSRKGYLTRRTWVVARRKLQSTQLSQGPILRRYGLGQLRVRVAGSSVTLPILTWSDAAALQLDLLTEPEPDEDALPRLNTADIEPL